MRKGDSASSKAAHESVSMRKPSACRATPPAGAPSRVKHHVPPSCSHGTARAGMRASTSSTVGQDGDERWEGVSKSSMTQKRMQECLVGDLVPFILGWAAMPKVVLSEPPVGN